VVVGAGNAWHAARVRLRAVLATLALAGLAAVAVGCGGGGGDTGGRRSGSGAAPATATTTAVPVVASPDSLHAPRSPAAEARTLGKVETALRGEDRRPEVLRTLGWEQQLAYRTLGEHPDWVPAVEGAVPAALRGVVDANVAAGAGLGGITAPQASLPDWTILTPKPADVLRGYYAEAEQATGVPWAYLAAIHFVETRMGRIHGNSSAGAQGPMQFIPSTWAAYGRGGDIDDDHDAILAAGRFLAANGGPADMERALFAYNHSRGYVAAVEDYARVMLDDPRAYDGYYQWQVYYATTSGVVRLPEGYGATR
jgi:transglycosylase-like protein with SLT domain